MAGRVFDWLFTLEGDAVIAKAIGLVLAGSFILLVIGLKITPKQIGA